MEAEFITCPNCKEKAYRKDLRADKTGSFWICANCYNKQHSKTTKQENVIKERLMALKESEKPVIRTNFEDLDSVNKIRSYKCNACNYKFESATFKLDKMCPFCGRAGRVERVKSTSQIIKEVEIGNFE